jgi:hypothetical protein
MFNHHGVVGECRSCRQLAPLGRGTVCIECRRAEEAEIGRLMGEWDRDLELLARFEAYCAERSVQGE